MQIAVLGMHRSGTSVLTRLLGFIGCHLGEADAFNPVRPDNPAGDWERTDVWALNEDVLSALDATWCRVARFDLGRLDETQRAALEGRAREIVARLDSRRPWAIKDPRLCLTLPVWRPALEAAVGVITHREPLAVARSLQLRDEFPLAVGVALWELHMLGSLRHSRGLARVGVAHRRLMNDPVSTLRELRRELEAAGVDGLQPADEAKVREFVDPSLVHAAVGPGEQTTYLNPSQRHLASALEDGSALSWDDVPPLSEGSRDLLDGYFGLADARDELRQDLAVAKADREELSRKNAELEPRVEELGNHVEELRRRIEELGHRIKELGRKNDELGRRKQELGRHNEALAERNAALTAQLQEQRHAYERDLDEVIGRGIELEKLIELVLSSRRWRYGDRAGELLGKVLRRPAAPGRGARTAHRLLVQKHSPRDFEPPRGVDGRLKVAVDASELCGRPTGVGRYLAAQLRHWVELGGEETLLLYLREDPATELPADPRVVLRRLPHGAVPFATYWQQVVLARELQREKPDVLFAPADAVPLGFGGPTVLTVHDLSYFAHPEWFDFRQGARRRWLTTRSVMSATRVIAVSEFTRKELVQRLDVPGDKIEVIPHGRDPRLDEIVPTPETELRSRLERVGPFALVVGSIFERRHITEVLDAFTRLPDLECGLILAGADRRRQGGDLHEEIGSRGLTGRVTWMDYCSEPDLVGLYRCAHHLIYLSDYEGFGLPPLEGMGFGLPAIVSGCEALAEVYGDSVLAVPALDARSIADGIRTMVTDPARRETLIGRGRRRVEALDSRASARRTLKQLRIVAGVP